MTGDTVLIIEDTPSLSLLYSSILSEAGYTVREASTAAQGYSQFDRLRPHAVLLDLMLPDRDGMALMRDCLRLQPETRFVVITANGSINRAVEAMRTGAYEFLIKPFDRQRLLGSVESALKEFPESVPEAAGGEIPVALEGFIGSSAKMQEVYNRIRSVGRSMATVFISGESGTGKEICAEAVHRCSTRADGPFVPLNCGAIPADLLESEVFGHLKGSFTGAIADQPGAAQTADGGTLFLDEICEMDLNLQTKMLRFLQTSMIQPVGAATPRKVNVRIVCATNRDPMTEVRAGRFREDLYYRLHVVPIHLPPLRDRNGDVIEIAEAYLDRFSKEEARNFKSLSSDVKAFLRSYQWPGNIRELLNVLRNIVVLNDGEQVEASMLPPALSAGPAAGAPLGNGHDTPETGLKPLIGRPLSEIERLVIEETIRSVGGSVPRTAQVLGVSPSTLYRKRDAWK